MRQGLISSRLRQVGQVWTFSAASINAAAKGRNISSFRITKCKAARLADLGPSPGNPARCLIKWPKAPSFDLSWFIFVSYPLPLNPNVSHQARHLLPRRDERLCAPYPQAPPHKSVPIKGLDVPSQYPPLFRRQYHQPDLRIKQGYRKNFCAISSS